MFVAAGGFVHARDWLGIYRLVPADLAGAAVVRVGFPINVGISALLVVVLMACAVSRSRFTPLVAAGGFLFQAGSLASLILSRTGSLFGWQEPAWTLGADQSRAVEIGALIALTGILAMRPSPVRPQTAISGPDGSSRHQGSQRQSSFRGAVHL